jgi:hypothetical protein
MSMSMNGNGVPPVDPMVPEDPADGVNALLRAIRLMAEKASMDPSAAEAADYANAALRFSQAIVVLDPNLTSDGVPLAHELAMEQQRQDGQERLERARQAAAAPTPGKQG